MPHTCHDATQPPIPSGTSYEYQSVIVMVAANGVISALENCWYSRHLSSDTDHSVIW